MIWSAPYYTYPVTIIVTLSPSAYIVLYFLFFQQTAMQNKVENRNTQRSNAFSIWAEIRKTQKGKKFLLKMKKKNLKQNINSRIYRTPIATNWNHLELGNRKLDKIIP